jgi:hypothetical protein
LAFSIFKHTFGETLNKTLTLCAILHSQVSRKTANTSQNWKKCKANSQTDAICTTFNFVITPKADLKIKITLKNKVNKFAADANKYE